jgi:hypothetical protein
LIEVDGKPGGIIGVFGESNQGMFKDFDKKDSRPGLHLTSSCGLTAGMKNAQITQSNWRGWPPELGYFPLDLLSGRRG